MHLLNTSSASLDDAIEPVDLRQPAAEMLFLSFTDSDLIGLRGAATLEGKAIPSTGFTHLKHLRHPMSVDLWIEQTAVHARFIVVRLLGGLDWWRYGVERLAALARERGIALAVLPGEDYDDPRLAAASTVDPALLADLLAGFRHGGVANMRRLLHRAAGQPGPAMADPTPESGTWLPGRGIVALDSVLAERVAGRPVVPILFYRSVLLADDFAPIAALCTALDQRGIMPLPLFVASLKTPAAAAFIRAAFAACDPAAIVTTTAFTAGEGLFDGIDAPVLQIILATTHREAWAASPRGLAASDLAMNVVLPELDGRVLTGAIAFKDGAEGFAGLSSRPEPDRVHHAAERIARLIRLRTTPPAARKIAMILPDYAGAPGRTGWAVGLDAPESLRVALLDLAEAGYTVEEMPADARALLTDIASVKTLSMPLATYREELARLPTAAREAIDAAWGDPADDTDVVDGHFRFRAVRYGNILVATAPDRGRSADRRADYHDPALPPRHALLAFGLWLQEGFAADAVVHMGAHGTLEWLPGKAVALTAECWPDRVVGPVPVIYPFIVSNPGEAAQAKRRIAAVTLGHLPPPAAEKGLAGPLRDLERLVDEYAGADGLDTRRRERLARLIVAEADRSGVAATLGLAPAVDPGDALRRIDAWLCDLKDLTVKDGLHIFGRADRPERAESATVERAALLAALDGRRIAPGPAGSPARGRRDVLPTGRNLYTADPRMLPTQTAMDLGRLAADEIVRLHLQEEGEYPRAIVFDLWSSATLRTGGEEIAQGLALLGCQPVWDHATGRVTGIEVLPPVMMGRPRIDVTWRISGLFRDLFPAQIALLALAVRTVAARDETDTENPLAAARRRNALGPRIFGSAPGTYGAGIEDLLSTDARVERTAIGAAYEAAASHAFSGAEGHGTATPGAFAGRVAAADALVHVTDDPDRDLLEGGGDVAFIGGFAAAAGDARLIILDTTDKDRPRARPLADALGRIVHGRAIDPRFIAGQMRHGPRGASELAETVDRLVAFAETTDAVADHLIDLIHAAYVIDPAVRDFLRDQNPAAARAIADRLRQARDEGLWHPRRNDVEPSLDALAMRAAI